MKRHMYLPPIFQFFLLLLDVGDKLPYVGVSGNKLLVDLAVVVLYAVVRARTDSVRVIPHGRRKVLAVQPHASL